MADDFRYTPPHMPAGSPAGGQFAPAGGGGAAGGKDARPTPGNSNPVGKGESGKRVSDLQSRLNTLGFKPPLKVDGVFGPKTLAAVRAFQKAHGLKVDGLVGPKTTAALRGGKHPAHHAPAKAPAHAPAKTPAKTAPAATAPAKAAPAKPGPRGTQPAGPARASDLAHGPGSALWKYWTTGAGHAKWSGAVHKWTTLRDLLLKAGVPPGEADGLATNIITAVMPGYMKQAHQNGKGQSAMTHTLDVAAIGEPRQRHGAGEICVRTFTWETRAAVGDGRTLEGYAAVFNTPAKIRDLAGEFEEIILPGAFRASLERKTPVLQFEHGRDPRVGAVPIGAISDIHEDRSGLYVQARLFDNAVVEPVRQAIAEKAISGMSFRFSVPQGGDTWSARKDGLDLREIRQIDTVECGPVVFPAYDQTSVSVRSLLAQLDPDEHRVLLREFAAELRAAGEDFTGRDGARSAPGGDAQEGDVQPGNGGPSTPTPTNRAAALRDRTWRMRRTLDA